MGPELGNTIFYNLPLRHLPQNLSLPGQPPLLFSVGLFIKVVFSTQ
jgi:hypothetical protein